jgi:hypothetical protein
MPAHNFTEAFSAERRAQQAVGPFVADLGTALACAHDALDGGQPGPSIHLLQRERFLPLQDTGSSRPRAQMTASEQRAIMTG